MIFSYLSVLSGVFRNVLSDPLTIELNLLVYLRAMLFILIKIKLNFVRKF